MPQCNRCENGQLESQKSNWFVCNNCGIEVAPENLKQ